MRNHAKRLPVIFFRTARGREPVREWLKSMKEIQDRKQVGIDIKTVEFGWPVGMPVCRPMGDGLFEVRSTLLSGRIARVVFYIDAKGRMVLLHGFVKKTEKTPQRDLQLAKDNKRLHERALGRA